MAAQSPAADPLLPTPPVALAQPLTRVWVLSVAAVGATADPDLEQQILELREQLGQWHYIEWIEVIGHTDSLGSEDYNQQLSVQRADRVAEQLILAGFDERSIAHIGVGESQPAADNGTQQGRADNRRVEIRVTGLGPWSEDAEVALAPR
jgi:OOP family OmpA-OmpF porin